MQYNQGRNEVRWRPGQETSLAPPCSNLRSFGSKSAESTCDIVRTFQRPNNDSAPGELRPPCSPSLHLCIQQKPKVQRFPFSSLGKRFESFPCTQELDTSGSRTLSCFYAMGRKFGSVFLPSVVHGLAPVIADVNS